MAILSIPYAATYDSKIMGFEIRVDLTVEIKPEGNGGSIHDIDIHEITCLPTLDEKDGVDWTPLKDFSPLSDEILAECEANVDYLVDKALS